VVKTHILVAFDDEHRAYRGVIAAGIQLLRPHTEVSSAGLAQLQREIERFDPQVVICSQPNSVDPGDRLAWIEIPLDPDHLAKVCIGGRRSESSHLLLEEVLAVVDEAERIMRKNVGGLG
jgi:hypothetical protein